jgi:ATP-dependent RNA helicase SUPV3L1/SUV3
MGLNLAIKRVIFESTVKSNGVNMVPLQISEIKQIAGRAGRFKTAHQATNPDPQTSAAGAAVGPAIGLDDKAPDNTGVEKSEPQTVGWATTLEDEDLGRLKWGMRREPEPIESAGLFPPSLIVERFANYFPPGTPFSYIMLRLHEISELHPRFHLCALKDQVTIADTIHTVRNLSIQDRIMLCAAPINTKDKAEQRFIHALATCIAEGKSGSLLDLDPLPLHVMDKPATSDRKYLYELEQLHKMIVCYLWLSYRFPNVFTTRALANYTKKLLEDQIEKTLNDFSVIELAQQRKKQREAAKKIGFESEETTEDKQRIPAPPGMSDEARDIMNDARLADDKQSTTDDEGEYPDDFPEMSELQTLAEQNQQRMVKPSEEAGDVLKNRTIDTANRDEATQPPV